MHIFSADPERFVRGGGVIGSNTDNVFFFVVVFLLLLLLFLFKFMREEIHIPLKAGHHWSASETPLKWRCAGVPIMAHH